MDIDPDNVQACVTLGLSYDRKGDPDTAISNYNKAIALDPNNAAAHANRGLAFHAKGDYVRAIGNYDRAIEIDAGSGTSYCNRAEAWMHLGEWDNAFKDLIAAKNRNVDPWKSFTNEYHSISDFETRTGLKLPDKIAGLLLT